MESNNKITPNNIKPASFWKIICAAFIDIVIVTIASSLIYTIWLMLGLPDFSYLWLTLFVLTSMFISTYIKYRDGSTPGNRLLRISPSNNQTNMAIIIIVIFVFIVTFIYSSFRNKSTIIENDYYEVTLPDGWITDNIATNNPTLYCISASNPANNTTAYFFTVNYDTSGIPMDALTNMVLGGLNRADISDLDIKDIEFQGCKAKKITGTSNTTQLELIVFLAPSGKLSYIFAQNMDEKDVDNLLSNIHVKNIQTPFADFEEVWKQFYGDNYDWTIYQPIADGIVLEGWKYDKHEGRLYMNLIIESDANDIKTMFEDNETKELFKNDLCNGQIMTFLAKNYNKQMLINIKDSSGNEVLSLPVISQN